MKHSIPILICCLFFTQGCDDDGGPGPIEGSCDMGGTGSGGTLAVTVSGGPIELESRSTAAQNTPQIESESPLCHHRLGSVRWGSCESGGAVFIRRGSGSRALAAATESEWSTDSIYNNSEVPLEIRGALQSFRVAAE